MAQSTYDINLQDTGFPMLSEQQTHTYINTKDGARQPHLSYCHNVLPTKYGLKSIDYNSRIPLFPGVVPATYFDDVRIVFATNKERCHMALRLNGSIMLLKEAATAWVQMTVTTIPVRARPVTFSSNDITTATVNGITYVFQRNFGCFLIDFDTNALVEVELIGLVTADFIGIIGSVGYLIAYTADAIVWSSTINPLDFVPSQVTGAGGGNIADVDGDIKFITYNSTGILVYAKSNIVSGSYTGNAQFPFKFREVAESKGGLTIDLVTYEANSAAQFAFSRAGLQAVSAQKAEVILPEISDFLSGGRFEDFNETTNTFERTYIGTSQTMRRKLKLVTSRYLVISYSLPGSVSYTHAIVFDKVLSKLGKLRIDHTDVFELVSNQVDGINDSLAVLTKEGRVYTVGLNSAYGFGVAIMGPIAFSPTRLLTLQEVATDNSVVGGAFEVLTLAALDGKNSVPITGTLAYAESRLTKRAFRATAKAHSIVVKGNFDLVNCTISYSINGMR
jgi:hypothetical protein